MVIANGKKVDITEFISTVSVHNAPYQNNRLMLMLPTDKDIIFHRVDYDISDMKECEDYRHCPYCGEQEIGLENAPFNPGVQYFKRYEVNGKKYPFEANLIGYSDEFANTHYGVTNEWNEIHCCHKCKRAYYTIHQH